MREDFLHMQFMQWFMALNPVMQGLIATLFTYFVTALGAATVFFFKTVNQKALDLMLGFAAGVMIAASFWSLLEPAISLSEELGNSPWLIPTISFLSGGILVIAADCFLSRCAVIAQKGTSVKRSILLAFSVTLHNIPEGLAVGVAFGSVAMGVEGATITGAIMLAFGIALQNFPEGICVSMPLYRDGLSRRKSFIIGQASGIVEPIAGVAGVLFALSMRSALPAASCSELIPESYKNNKIVAGLGILLGFSVMMALDVALG
jgi:ZIP family zinc transporter